MSEVIHAATSLVDVLQERAARRPDSRAYTFLVDGETEGARWSYGELDQRARAVAALLQRRHRAGERALLLYPPGGLDFLAAFYGCLYAGIIAIPAPPPDPARLKRALPRLQTIVEDSEATLILGTASVLELLDRVDESLPALTGLQRLATEQTPGEWAEEWRRPHLDGDTIAYLQYTSGSTSSPKGVVLAHSHVLHNLAYNRRRWGYGVDSGAICWMPYFHDYGLVEGLMQPAFSGIPGYIMSPLAFLRRPLRWLQAISRYRLTHSASPNFGFDHCVERIPAKKREGLDLSSWRVASCGAEVVRAETMERFIEAFAPYGLRPDALYPAYGLAEATLLVTTRAAAEPSLRVLELDPAALEEGSAQPAAGDRPERRVVSCGTADGDMRLVIVDPETRRRLPEGAVGEVWVSSPSVAAGYWKRPRASEETFRARIVASDHGESEETYLRTGDLGFLHHGELYVSGRMKDLIIIRGSNHFPEDVERTVEAAHPLLRSNACAVFSVESEGEERLVVAAEVDRSFADDRLDEVVGAIRQAVAEAHDVEVWAIRLLRRGSVLKTSSGKIQRAGSRRAFLDGELEVVGEHTARRPASPVPQAKTDDDRRHAIEAWVAARLGARLGLAADELDRGEPFARYGLDSAAAVSLVGELEEWLGRELPETLLYEHPTLERLAAHLTGEPGERRAALVEPGGADAAEPVAVIGLGCRFPGADGPEAFWRLLSQGVDAVREVPPERWDAEALYAPEPATRGKSNSRWGGFVDAVDRFDADFFGISPREAARMDPQQRLLLEVAWSALEHAGIVPAELAGSSGGVFVGISTNDYRKLQHAHPSRIDAYAGTGNALSIAANRISYALDLRGPSLAIDTACSSSLVAVHAACRSLRDGECSLALAGGVNLMLAPEWTLTFSQARMMASDGRCKTFDAAADGYVRGEGCGVVALKRLSDARRDGDRVLAVILGSAVNQDGRSNGLTAPNGGAQEEVLRRALAAAGVRPEEVGAVEAHGTGTPLGDPIEVGALAAVLGAERDPKRPFFLSSVKTNIGHLEAAAGVAGLIKSVLCLEREAIAPHLHFERGNPRLDWEELPLRVPTRLEIWPRGDRRRVAGVSSFGFGGTNCHLVLAESPDDERVAPQREEGPCLLVLSARGREALGRQASAWSEALSSSKASWQEICAAAAHRRSHFAHRLALVAEGAGEAASALAEHVAGRPAALRLGVRDAARPPRIGFLFTGQGAQHPGMGRALYAAEPAFRAALDRCAEILGPRLEYPLLTVLHGDGWESELLHQTAYTQPCLFALEYALAEMWRAWGIEPHAVLGHSVGEYVAACIAGVLELEEALELVSERARLMQELPEGGAMASVLAGEEAVAEVLEKSGAEVSIAAVNGPASTVLSGSAEAIAAALAALAAADIDCRRLRVSHAFHSPLMEPAMDAFERFAATLDPRPPRLPLVRNLDGRVWAEGSSPDAAYWRRHALAAVRFADGVASLAELGCEVLLEIGPHPTLVAMARRSLPPGSAALVSTLHREEDDRRSVLEALGALYAEGCEPRWEAVYGERTRQPAGLPTYRFERTRHWLDYAEPAEEIVSTMPAPSPEPAYPWLGERRGRAGGGSEWALEVGVEAFPFLDDHRVQGALVLPAACYLEMVLEAAEREWGSPARELSIEAVSVHRALFLPEEGSVTLRLELEPREESTGFRILAAEEGSEDRLFADGVVVRTQTPPEASVLDLAALRASLGESTPGRGYYRSLAALGLDYGPCHQGIAEISSGDGEALARIVTPPPIAAEAAAQRLHPALLDAAWQTLAAAIPPRLSATPDGVPWLPVALSGLRVLRTGPVELWCRARVQPPGEADDGRRLRVEIVITDAAGRLVARCDELTVQRLEPVAPPEAPLYELRWEPVDAPPPSAPPQRSWLLVGDDAELLAALAAELGARGVRALTAAPEGASLELASAGDGSIAALFEALPETPAEVVMAWSGAGIAGSLDGVRVAAGLCRALSAAGAGARLACVTYGAQQVEGAARDESLPAAALWGLGRTLAQEMPERWRGLIDLDPELPPAAAARAAAGELLAAKRAEVEDQVALRAGERRAPRLVALDPPAAAGRFAARPDAAYLITGGLGDLGLATARWLVERGARELLLVGRTPLAVRPTEDRDRRRVAAVEALRATGIRVEVAALDVGERGALERWLDARRAAGRAPVRGVVHAAGAVSMQPFTEIGAERLSEMLRPKLAGGLELDRLFGADAELDFFLLYSSVSALLASPRLAPYAAANACLDALAERRRRRGLPALSVRWPGWAEVGMAARHGVEPAKGMRPIGADEAFAWLDRWLAPAAATPAVLSVLPIEWRRWAAAYPAAASAPLLRRVLAAGAAGAGTGAGDSPAAAPIGSEPLADVLAALVAEVLELPPERLDRARPLNRLGLDSLMAVEIKNRVESEIGVTLSVVTFLKGPSVEELAATIAAELGTPEAGGAGAAEPAASPAAGPAPPPVDRLEGERARRLLETVDDLSDDEVGALLDRMLELEEVAR